jgi:hypothetical protein
MTMPTMPKAGVDIYSEEDMRNVCQGLQAGSVRLSDWAANAAAALHPRIVATLRQEGLGAGLLGMDARRVASRVTRHLKTIAELEWHVAQTAVLLNRSFVQNVAEPVRQARHRARQGTRQGIRIS